MSATTQRVTAARTDLGDYLDDAVYPALFDRLDTAFPEFGFRKRGGAWEATRWPADFPFSVEHQNAARLMVYPDRPWWIKVHGHSGVRLLEYVNGGRRPTGADFPAAVKTLCERGGVEFPEISATDEDREKARREEERRAILERVYSQCETVLWSETGAAARAYLNDERKLSDEHLRDLEIGLYPPADEVRRTLRAAGYGDEAIRRSGAVFAKMEGFAVVPWPCDRGHGLTIYGRWPGRDLPLQKDHPGWKGDRREALSRWQQADPEWRAEHPWTEPTIPKTLALPGAETKRSPLFLDRALAAGHREVNAMEGVFDACTAQVFGDRRAVAYVAAQFSGEQVRTLQRRRIESVTICPDPDGGGDRGAVACVKALTAAGITAYVCPRLPDGLDPDEFILLNGVDAWRQHVEGKIHGLRHIARAIINKHKPGETWTDHGLSGALDDAAEFASSVQERCEGDLDIYFWPEIAAGTGVSEAAARAAGRPTSGRGRAAEQNAGASRNGDTANDDPAGDPEALLEAAKEAKAAGDDVARAAAVRALAELLGRNGADPLTIEEWAQRVSSDRLGNVGPFKEAVRAARRAFQQEQVDAARRRRVQKQDGETAERTAGSMLTDAPAPDLIIPSPYVLRDDRTAMVVPDDLGEEDREVVVAYAPILITGRLRDAEDGREYLRLEYRRQQGWHRATLDRGIVMDARKLVEQSSAGFPVASSNVKSVVAYHHRLEAANFRRVPYARVSSHLGWQGADGKDGFLWGRQLLLPDGTIGGAINLDEIPPEEWREDLIAFRGTQAGDEQIAAGYHARGTPDGWYEAVAVLANYPRALLAFYASLAAPLLAILSAPNFIVDLANRTTTGKTIVARVAASIWGNPDEHSAASAIWTWDATRVWSERASAVLSGMPLILDDTKRAKDRRAVADLLYAVASGKGRGRGNPRGLAATRSWRTILISTGEAPCTSYTQDGGTRTRVIEVRGIPFGKDDQETRRVVDLLDQRIRSHYGHAGPAFVRYLLQQREQWPTWRKELAADAERLATEAATAEAGRLAQYAATIGLAAALAHAALPLPWPYRDPLKDLWPLIAAEGESAAGEVRALRDVVSWAHSHREAFQGRHRTDANGTTVPPAAGWAGCWTSGDDWDEIAFLHTVIEHVLKSLDYEPSAILAGWRERDWLEKGEKVAGTARERPNPARRLFGEQKRMVVIKRSAVETVEA